MIRNKRRLELLEMKTPHCRTCRQWHEPGLIRTLTTQDPDAASLVGRPAVCPDCGRPTPTVITTMIVQIDDELA